MKSTFMKFACAGALAWVAFAAQAEGEVWGLVDAVYAGDAIPAAEAWPFRPDVNAFSNPGNGNCKVTTYFGNSLAQDPSDWVPKKVYLTERYNLSATASTPLICTFSDLTPNAAYRLRYCGAETYYSAAGKRVFKLVANGGVLENGLDLVARAGGNFRAFAQDYDVTADADGVIAVSVEKGTIENPKYGGLALFGQTLPIVSAPTAAANAEDGSKVDISCTARDAHSLTLQRAEAEEGPWTDVFTQFAGHKGAEVLTTSPASAVNWYRVVASNGVGTVTSAVCRYELAVQWGLVDAVYGHSNDYSLWPFRSDRGQVAATAGSGTLQCGKSGNSINRGSVPDAYAWVPNDIFQIERYINAQSSGQELVNTFSGLNPNAAYRLVYLAAETWKAQSGIRRFSMKVNGVSVLTDFDLYVASGAANRAYIQEFGVISDAQGKIAVSFTSTVNNGKYGGFLLYGNSAPLATGVSLDVKPLTGTNAVEAVFSAKSAHTCTLLKSTASENGPWTEVTRVFSGAGSTTLVDPVALNQDTWYCVTASNGLGCVTGAVSCVKKEYPVYSFNIGPEPDPVGDFLPCDFLDMSASDPTTYANEVISGMDDVAHPIPSDLWKWSVYAKKFRFVLPNLRPDKTYALRLYGVDTYATAAGVRVVKLYVNGVQTGEPIDFFARAGVKSKTLEYDYTGLVPAADGTLEIVLERTANFAQFAALQVVEENGEGIPLTPAVKGAYAGPAGVYVAIGSQTGGLAYEVRRRPANGGAWTTVATDVTGGLWIDVGATGGCEYAARAVQKDGATSEWSAAVGVTAAGEGPKAFLGAAAVAMTGARGEYSPLAGYSLKDALSAPVSTSSADWSAVRDPLPSAAWLQGVTGSSASRLIQLTLKGLYPRANHLVRVHLSDVVSTAAGQRLISLYAGGRLFADHADLVAVNPVTRTVVFETCVCADATGTIHLYLNSQFTNVSSTPTLHGVEAILQAPGASAGAMTMVRAANYEMNEREIAKGGVQTVALDWDANGRLAGTSVSNNIVFWNGTLTVPTTTEYTFTADQIGSGALYIDDTCVARRHSGASTPVSGTIRLTAGGHRFRYRWGQWNDGGCRAQVRWSSSCLPEQVVGAPYLTHEPSVPALVDPAWNFCELSVGGVTPFSGDASVVGTNAAGGAVWRLASDGADVFSGNAQGIYLYQWLRGEFELTLRVMSMDRFITNTKGGVLMMEKPQYMPSYIGDFLYGASSVAGGASMGSVRKWEILGGDFLTAKSIALKANGNGALPLWLRVRRFSEGGAWKAGVAYSLDGETWAAESVFVLPHGGPVCVGPYFCAHTNAVNPLPCMEIDNVSLKVKGNCVIYIR